jgi:hypothetical protein
MPQKRCTSEQIVAKLRQVDVAVAPRVIVGRAPGRPHIGTRGRRRRNVSDALRHRRVTSRARRVSDALRLGRVARNP